MYIKAEIYRRIKANHAQELRYVQSLHCAGLPDGFVSYKITFHAPDALSTVTYNILSIESFNSLSLKLSYSLVGKLRLMKLGDFS